MNNKKTVHLTPENHDFLRKLRYLNNSTIELELDKIVSEKRIKED